MSNDANHLPEMIDSCRASADDLRLPEMRELAQRVQDDPAVAQRLRKSRRIDDLIGRAIREVPVPAGLEERLMAALSCPSLQLSTATAGPSLVKSSSSHRSRFGSRKAWGTVAACAAALLAVFILVRPPKLQLESQADVAAASREWLKNENLSAEQWVTGIPPGGHYPLPRKPIFRPYEWQQVMGDSGSPGVAGVVCYNVSQDQPPRQLLFVCRVKRSEGLSDVPPTTPTEAAPGWLVGGWRSTGSDGLVYILAVKGGKHRYESLLQRTPTFASSRYSLNAEPPSAGTLGHAS